MWRWLKPSYSLSNPNPSGVSTFLESFAASPSGRTHFRKAHPKTTRENSNIANSLNSVPARNVSGFRSLYADNVSGCESQFLKVKCGALVGIERIRTYESSLATCVQTSGLSADEVRRALDVLQKRSRNAMIQMWDTGTSPTLLPGSIFVTRLFVFEFLSRRYGYKCHAEAIQSMVPIR